MILNHLDSNQLDHSSSESDQGEIASSNPTGAHVVICRMMAAHEESVCYKGELPANLLNGNGCIGTGENLRGVCLNYEVLSMVLAAINYL